MRRLPPAAGVPVPADAVAAGQGLPGLPAVMPGAVRGERMRAAAAWLFVLPLFTEGVLPDVAKIQAAGLAVVALAVLAAGSLPPRAVERVFAVAAVLTLTVMAYLAFGHWPAQAGSARSYDRGAVMWAAELVAAAVFAALFFDEEIFARVVWRGATIALWAGMLTCVLSRLTGHALLVNTGDGALRMQGGAGEPSDWAPVLTLVLLLALRRRSRLYVVLALAGLLLADSPTCMLVMALTLPLYAALASTWRHRMVLLAALAAVIPAAVVFVLHANPQGWLDSGNSAEVAAGRLISGIRNVQTGGAQGANSRFESTAAIVAVVRDGGWMRLGAGPAADATYLPAMYPSVNGTTVAANALWVSVLFDFGETGVAVLAVLMAAAAWRMRRFPVMCAVLLPFLVALAVNSDGADVPFGALAVMAFACGWAQRANAGCALQASHQGVAEAGVPVPSR
jgi:O-Antigen ligase